MSQSISEEFQHIDLGDKRLNDNAAAIAEAFAAKPAESINASFDGNSPIQRAYEFFKNDRVQPEKILQAHRKKTLQRFEPHDTILVVQDTTEIDYQQHPTEDAGVLDQDYRKGLYDHTTLAFTENKLCLGVLGVEWFSREPETLGQSQSDYKQLPIEQKESFRWLKEYRRSCDLSERFPEKQIICVADSEADLYDIYYEQTQRPRAAEYVIRRQHPRKTPQRQPDKGPSVFKAVSEEVGQTEPVTEIQLNLPSTGKRVARTATLEVRAKHLEVKKPHAGPSRFENIRCSVVQVTEVNGPQDGSDVSWELYSSLPVSTLKEIMRIIEIYVARWPIEVYFRVLKTGCRVERLQLKIEARRRRALMMYHIVAWRIMYLTFLGRHCPDLPCDVVFAESEWKPVWKIANDAAVPDSPPRLGAFMISLAKLGGYNGRASDPPPGTEAIWRGTRRMMDFAIAWKSFGPEN